MREILFQDIRILENCYIEEEMIVFKKDSSLEFFVEVKEEGYYSFTFSSLLEHGDAWHLIEVQSPLGETIQYKLGHSMSIPLTDTCIRLSQGVNRLRFTGDYGTIRFKKICLSDRPVLQKAMISPVRDYFYKASTKHIKIHLLHYDLKVTKITADDIKLPYIQRVSDIEELVQGDGIRRSDIIIEPGVFAGLSEGLHDISIHMDNGQLLKYQLYIMEEKTEAPFEILNFNIDHGNATLLTFPNGKHLLIDSAKDYYAENVILPFLERNNIKIDYYLLTHFHDDHNGLLEEILLRNHISRPGAGQEELADLSEEKRFSCLGQSGYLDNYFLRPFDCLHKIWDLGGVEIRVLNSGLDRQGNKRIDYPDENNYSTSLNIEYNGFRYHHGADNYADTEENILIMWEESGQSFPECDYFYANHHFHGSVNDSFIRHINPVAVYVSAQGAVYARGAYTTVYQNAVSQMQYPGKRLTDTLLSCEVGSALVQVWSGSDWHYETYNDLSELFL